jgi:hypothetical protein
LTVIRWIAAVVAGIVVYFAVVIMSLGIFQLAVEGFEQFQHPDPHTNVAQSALFLCAAIFLSTYAGCLASIAVAPRRAWKTMAGIALGIGIVWTIYGQIGSGHPLSAAIVESVGGIVGALLAYTTARRLYGRRFGLRS